MTAEIVVANTEAVAMAADSAVTLDGPDGRKIFTSANKLFALSHSQPIGIMVYGNATLLDISWETLVKLYRGSPEGQASHPTVEEAGSSFLDFLRANQSRLFPEAAQARFVYERAFGLCVELLGELVRTAQERFDTHSKVTAQFMRLALRRIVERHAATVTEAARVPRFDEGSEVPLFKRYRAATDEAIDAVFVEFPVSRALRDAIGRLTTDMLTRQMSDLGGLSGAVIAGFGEDDLFPRIRQYFVDGMVGDVLRCETMSRVDIDPLGTQGVVRAFAQSEMVSRFLDGVDPAYQHIIDQTFQAIVSDYLPTVAESLGTLDQSARQAIVDALASRRDAVLATIDAQLASLRSENFTQPVGKIVSVMPKDELASMAESLVNLTSFKRRISLEAETVAGPIDVAVISKGDGLVWIKRKHYFDPVLNPRFMARYQGR